MKAIIIGSSDGTPNAKELAYYQEYREFFSQSAKKSLGDITIHSTFLDDLFIEVGEGSFTVFDTRSNLDLSAFDVIFFRGKFRSSMDVVATVNEYATQHGVYTVNTYRDVRDSSKLLQAVHFETLHVPVARTLLVSSGLFAKQELLDAWRFPCIMKASHGAHGNDNYLVHSFAQVQEIAKKDSTKRFVLQRFIENDGDFRILLVGDEVLVIGRAGGEGTHLNNTSQGGAASLVEANKLPQAVLDQAHSIARFFKMTIAGVDVLQSKKTGEYFFLEVNAQPQLMTGAFVDMKLQLVAKLFNSLAHER